MPSLAEVARAIYGAWRLMLFDADGMTFFDLSTDGFWRSFFAAVVVAPAYVLFVAVDFASAEAEAVGPAWAAIVEGVAYLVDWVAFPIAAILVTRLLGVTGRYVPLIVGLNWSHVPQLLFLVPAELMLVANVGFAGTFATLVLLFILTYKWFVVRVALDVTAFTAVAIVIMDFLLSLVIHASAASLL